MMFSDSDRLSLSTLLRLFWKRISLTWVLTLAETAMIAALPLFIGWSIDGLLQDDYSAFSQLLLLLTVLLITSVLRRVYDTRAYGGIRVELGKAQAERGASQRVSVTNARLQMGRELVDFLEEEAPLTMTALVQIIASLVILFSFGFALAASALVASVLALLVYWAFSQRFFRLNALLNRQTERQVTYLEGGVPKHISLHLWRLRTHEVRLSDTESVVYGLIYAFLLGMLVFNLWYATTQLGSSVGQIFSIITYSYEFVQASVMVPAALQSLTRLSEITERINASTPDQQ